jgi:hypothetical protein
MKTKEEISELAKGNDRRGYERNCFIDGYTQCQEDMVKNYTEREVVIMLQDCAIHFGIMNKSKDDGTFTTQIDKWVKNKLNKQD